MDVMVDMDEICEVAAPTQRAYPRRKRVGTPRFAAHGLSGPRYGIMQRLRKFR